MARWPAAGRCKSRLAAGLGPARAAAIQGRLTGHTLAAARQARQRLPFELVLAVAGLGPRAAGRWGASLGCDRVVPQGDGGLGLRLQRQVVRARAAGVQQLVLVGSDLPELHASDLEQAFALLGGHDLVLGPARDGGYWLIALSRSQPALFCGMPWGSDRVLAQTCSAAERLALTPALLAERSDLDRPADLGRWR